MPTDIITPTLDDRLRFRNRPSGRSFMLHTWQNLLFLHWRVEPERIQRRLPRGLYVDTYDGAAYVGVVPFFMRNIRLRGTPALPWLSNFLELNVRTYVHDATGAPGIWFYSLDCNQPLAVWGARTFYHLPYRHARMSATTGGDGMLAYRSQVGERRTEFSGRLHDVVRTATPGTFEFFVAERYLLFAASRSERLFTGRVFHEPYPLVKATLDRWSSNLFVDHDWGVDESRPDHVLASPGVDVEVFGLERVRG
jgi:uncharacterized protein YqjF (DUF2071 family)